MNSRLELLYHRVPSPSVTRLRELAEFLGVATSLTEVGGFAASGSTAAVVVDVSSLAGGRALAGPIAVTLTAIDVPVLLLISEQGLGDHARALSEGAITAVTAGRATSIHFRADSVRFSGELASHSFPRTDARALWLECHPDAGATSIMEVGGGVSLAVWSPGHRLRFAWATPGVCDTKAVVGDEIDFECALDRVIPFVIFLRQVFGERCWHNPMRDAAFIIDDPLLTSTYGSIDFPRLLASARRNAYHVTLAFIPWNAWRSRRGNVRLFREYADCFSLCVHGCDHNRHEYGSPDYDLLLDKNRIAVARMDRQAQRLGMPYVPIMVCPQEECSLEAWRSFADNRRLLAMMNTGCLPRNASNTIVSIQDLLLPAHDAFFGFPIFKRYYSKNGFSWLALCLFLGKPAILVEHHDYFRGGLGGIEDFVRRLRKICPSARWRSPETIAVTTHARRKASPSTTDIRFFANRFTFDPAGAEGQSFRLRKRIHDRSAVRGIRLNGAEVDHDWEGDFAVVHLAPTVRGAVEIEVDLAPILPRRVYSFSPWYQAGVATRRALSELRDNVIFRNPRALETAQSVARALGLRSGGKAKR